jgi:hypothetical protein
MPNICIYGDLLKSQRLQRREALFSTEPSCDLNMNTLEKKKEIDFIDYLLAVRGKRIAFDQSDDAAILYSGNFRLRW